MAVYDTRHGDVLSHFTPAEAQASRWRVAPNIRVRAGAVYPLLVHIMQKLKHTVQGGRRDGQSPLTACVVVSQG